MKKPFISGIQQVGIGNPAVHKTFDWYRKTFGTDIPIFEEAAEAALMLPYTEGEKRQRHAILAINIQGGGGLEIWQYTSRTPVGPDFDVQLGDLGIHIAKYKSKDVASCYEKFRKDGIDLVGELSNDPLGQPHFYLKDLHGNLCEVVHTDDEWFKNGSHLTGGVYGCVLGVSDIEKSMAFYGDILGYDEVLYDESGPFVDLQSLPGAKGHEFRRVLLKHSKARQGAFSRMLGPSQMELIQVLDRQPRKIYENRMWGDLGYIHLCFDISGMAEMKALCASKGHPFTVDSGDNPDTAETFDMGEAAGHFSYIEDPDGTLIEFVETHKLPILKKINWYLNLKNRQADKPLPNWMLKTLAFSRVKD